jgi:quercetin dioxygenase-like cupin family protein
LVEDRTGVLTCADGEFQLRPDAIIHFEPNTWHSAMFETDTVLIEVDFALDPPVA